MKATSVGVIRDVVLIGHGGSGKTSLTEAALFAAGVTSRMGKAEEGNTASDYDPEAVKHHISVNLSLLPVPWKDLVINLIDTPGYSEFVGEVLAALRVAESAIVVVDATAGIEVGTEQVWGYADERSLPRAVLVSKMDREEADFGRVLDTFRRRFGSRCAAIQLPIGAAHNFQGVIDLVTMQARLGPKGDTAAIPAELQAAADSAREQLIEAIAETDDTLLTKYLDGETLSPEEVEQAMRAAIAQGKLIPFLAASGLQNVGVTACLDAIGQYLPSPQDAPPMTVTDAQSHQEVQLTADPDGILAALAFKTTADPYVGRLTYLRVFSGILESNSQVWNSTHHAVERIGQLYLVRGKTQEPVDRLIAGEIGATAKLTVTGTGDCLCRREHPLSLSPIALPAPVYSVAISPKTKADLDKLSNALNRILEEDPTLQVNKDPDTNETLLMGMGETHVDIAGEKMRRKFGVEVTVATPRVPYKETITAPTKAEYKHKKQTGGHGQYGHVLLEFEPLPRGSGVKFEEKVFGGSVPKNYIPAVEKGVMEAAAEGTLAHFPVVDVKAVLYDGSYHDVDSSDMSFKIAGSMAFKKGVSQAQPVILEPVVYMEIKIPEAFMGEIIGDLNSKRSKVLGFNSDNGIATVEALAPLAEVQRYAIDLRSMTQGRGTYTMHFDHFDEVPGHIAQRIITEANKEREAVKV